MTKVAISADMTEAYGMVGAITGMSKTVRTSNYKASILKFAHAEMSEQMDSEIDLLALANPKMFRHVYEWGMVGVPAGRLWAHTLIGTGGNRTASFKWKASKLPVPSPSERANNPDDPMSMVPADVVARLSNRKHFFYWKAPIMEYGLRVRIEPRNAKKLFIPLGELARNQKLGSKRTYVFTEGPVFAHPGAQQARGAFSAAWATWWGSRAEAVFSETVERTVGMDLEGAFRRGASANTATRKRAKTISLAAISSQQAAAEIGEDLAAAYLEGRARSYTQARRWLDG